MATYWMYIVAALTIPLAYVLQAVIKVVIWLWKVKKIQSVVDNFTVGPKPHWLYGHHTIITGPNEDMLKTILDWTVKADKGAFAFNLGLSSQLELCHPDTIKLILKTAEPKGFIPATSTSYKLLVPWLGDGLLTSSGGKWFRNRRLLTPGFHFDILRPYMKIYNDCSEKMVATFEKQSKNGASVEVFKIVSLCTLNVMRKCAFSSKEDVQGDESDSQYITAVTEMSDMVMARLYSPILYPDVIYNKTKIGKKFFELCELSHIVADEVIKQRRANLKVETTKQDRYVDFLDILLLAKDADGNGLTDLEIRDEVETFMFEGHDTTASAISWALYNFARHPDIQQKAYEEIEGIFHRKSIKELEWNDLDHIPYITRCIKESMRVHPPVPLVLRELTKPLQVNGHTLLPGTITEIQVYALHHNPRVWGDDHMIFNPDRFLPNNMAGMDSFAYVPFSAGPRNCIGQNFAMNEIKTTIAHVLFHFEMSVDMSHPVEMVPSLILRAKYGLKIHFKRRENVH